MVLQANFYVKFDSTNPKNNKTGFYLELLPDMVFLKIVNLAKTKLVKNV